MPQRITRGFAFRPKSRLSLTTSAATTPEVNYEEFSGGSVFVPAGSSITLLTFHAAPWGTTSQSLIGTDTPAPTFLPLLTSAAVAVTLTVAAGKCYALPADLFGVGAFKMVADAAGAVDVSLKG